MAELKFFLSKNEKLAFIEFCFAKGCKLVPDLNYPTNEYAILSNVNEYLNFYDSSNLFFLIHEDYSLYPLEPRQFDKDGQKKYYVQQRYGGPMIDFYSPNLAEVEDGVIGPGFIGIYPFYYRGKDKIEANESLKNMYNLFLSCIKKQCKKIKIADHYYWIGNTTMEKVKDGIYKMVDFPNVNWREVFGE